MPTAFATASELTPAELAAAPVRYPAPLQLERPLLVEGAKAAQGAQTLGLENVRNLLEHLPRDRHLVGRCETDERAWIFERRDMLRRLPGQRAAQRPAAAPERGGYEIVVKIEKRSHINF